MHEETCFKDLRIVNATDEEINRWKQFIEIDFDEIAESDYFYWGSETPDELLDLDASDVYYENRPVRI
jgi:hypothetical protein